MSIDRIFYCDWSGCRTSMQTTGSRPHPSFLTVTGGGSPRALHFCSWDCVLKHAAEKPPRFVQAEPRKILWYTSDRRTSEEITELMNTIALNSQQQTIVNVDER